MKKIVITLTVILLLVSCSNNKVEEKENIGENKNNEVTVKSDEVIIENPVEISEINDAFNMDLKSKDFEALANNYQYTQDMAAFMTDEAIADIFMKLDAGDIVTQLTSVESKSGDYRIFSTPTKFERAAYDVNLVFDQDNLIAGFNLGTFTGVDKNSSLDLIDLAERHHLSFSEADYEKLKAFEYSSDMLKLINNELFEKTFDQLNLGMFKSAQAAYQYSMGAYEIVSIPVTYENRQFNYDLVFDNTNAIAGLNVSEYNLGPEDSDATGILEIPKTLTVNDMTLEGILTTPDTGRSFPTVILVHGSGASDKDETIMQNKPFKDLAWGLAKLGVASYRYDKSNFAHPELFSTLLNTTLYEETINDAVAIVDLVKAFEAVDAEKVYVLGHSLGGYSIPLIAEETDVKGFVIMAGNARPLNVLIEEQVNYLINLDGLVETAEEEYLDTLNSELAQLDDLEGMESDEAVLGAYKAYWTFLSTYDPVEHAKSIDDPVLLLQGERDYQVTLEDYAIWYENFGESTNWTFKSYEFLNHLMMPGEGPPSNADYQISNTVDESVIKDIVDWMTSH